MAVPALKGGDASRRVLTPGVAPGASARRAEQAFDIPQSSKKSAAKSETLQPAAPPRTEAFMRGPKGSYAEREAQETEDAKPMRIGNFTAGLMLGLAVLLDVLQILFSVLHVVPVAGTALAFVLTIFIGVLGSWIVFPFWFKLCGVEYLNGTQALAKLGALAIPAVVEFIGILNAIPAMLLGVAVTILITRFEDVFGEEGAAGMLDAGTTSPEERRKMLGSFISGQRYRAERERNQAANDN